MEPGRVQFALPSMTPGVKLLLIINAAVFVLTLLLGESLGQPLSYYLAVSWEGLWEYAGLGLLRLVTSLFAHSYVDPWHFLLNMLVLYFFGTMVESEVGKKGIVHLYLIGGLVGNLAQFLVAAVAGYFEAFHGLGASGACYALLIYAACMAPRSRVIFIIFLVELRWVAIALVGLGLYATVLEFRGHGSGGVAHGAHLGGALYGWIAFKHLRGYYLSLGYGRSSSTLLSSWRRWRADREAKSEVARRQKLDELLDKVHREGMSSLTESERRFLEKASRDARRR